MANRIQYRRDTSANWTAANPVLALGEPGYETDTKASKIGDGATAWSALNYVASVLACTGVGDETAKINAWLAASTPLGVKRIVGNPSISAPLVIPSGTYLDATGAKVTLASASNCNIVTNAAVTAQRSVSDAAITSGTNTLTSATAAFTSADTGRSVIIAGAAAGGYLLVANMTFVNATTVTLSVNATATVSGAAASFYNRDAGITLIGGTWDRGTNAGSGVGLHNILFRHVDGLVVRDVTVKSGAGKYALSIGDVTNVRIRDITFAAFSDGIHIAGPASNLNIGSVFGTTGDDSVAITPNDWSAYADTAGDVTDVTIENVYTTSTAAAAVKVLGGSPATAARRVSVRNVYGTANNNAVFIGDDTAQAGTTGGLLDAVSVENVRTSIPNAQSLCYINGSNIKTLRIHGVHLNNASATAAPIRFVPLNASTLGSLTVENVNVTNMGAGPIVQVDTNGTISRFLLDKVTVTACASGATGVLVKGVVTDLGIRGFLGNLTNAYLLSLNGSDAGATVNRATISDCHIINTGAGLVSATVSTHTLPNIEVSNTQITGSAWLLDLNTTTEIHLAGVTLKSPTQGIANLRANSVVTFDGAGNALAAGSQNIKMTSGGKAAVRTWDIPPSTTTGGFPTIAAGAGAGTGPTVTVAGTDRAGTVTITPGTSPSAGVQGTVTFVGTWPQTPKLGITPTNAAAQAAGLYVSSKSTTTFAVSSANTPGGSMTFDYVIAA